MNDITPKEAIANLNHLYGMVAPDIQRSLDVAIKCMEERPTGDLISREALKTELNSRPFPQDYSTTLLLGTFNELIDNALPVDAIVNTIEVRPQGKWIFVNPLQADDGGAYICSNCNTGNYGVEEYKYCPYCGARMEEAEENA